jgi:hypothetical protein
MQREQKLKLEKELGSLEEGESEKTTAYVAKREPYVSKESSQKRGYHKSADTRTCFACGGLGHIKAHCWMRKVECHNCGKIGHIKAVCKKSGQGARSGTEVRNHFSGVAFTAWRSDTQRLTGIWVVDLGSTQHITPDRGQFASYRELAQAETIEGIGGEPLIAIGIGEVELQCKTVNDVSKVTLKEVPHVPEVKASLFALKRATDARARVVMERRVARFEMGGIVRMEAVQKDGLFEIATVEKPMAFLAVEQTSEKRVKELARKPQMKEEIAKVQKKTLKVIEVDLDSDDENGGPGEGFNGQHDDTTGEQIKAAEGVGETTERVRAEKGVSGAGKSGEKEREIFETRARYCNGWTS